MKAADKKSDIIFLDEFFSKKITEGLNKKALMFNTEYINEAYNKMLKEKKFDQKEVGFIKAHLKHKHDIIVYKKYSPSFLLSSLLPPLLPPPFSLLPPITYLV